MSPVTVKIHNADSMVQKQLSATDGRVVLFHPQPVMVWVAAIAANMDRSLSLTSGSDFAEVGTPSDSNRGIATWLFRASNSPIYLENLDDSLPVKCFVGTLPEPLIALANPANGRTALAVREMLERLCGGQSLDGAEADGLNPAQAFELFRGCAVIARRLGQFVAETRLLAKALDIRPSTNLTRLLSYAAAHAQDYSLAITAAEAALRAKPELANGPFRDHITELRTHCEIADELQQIAISSPSRAASQRTIGYCLHNARPYAHGGYAMRSHALAVAITEAGRPLNAFTRPGFPSDGALPGETPSGQQSVDGIVYHFENGFGRRSRAYGYIAEAADYFEYMFAANQIGVVHAASNFWTALPAALAARRAGLPFIYEVRSFWAVTREAREPGFVTTPQAARDDSLEAIVLALADQVVTLNSQMRDQLISMGVDGERVTIIPNCVDADRFALAPPDTSLVRDYGVEPGDLVIGYMGAMLHYEGIDLLIEAAAPLIRGNSHIKLILVGADPKKTSDPLSIEQGLVRQITRLGLEDGITLVDRVSPDMARRHYGVFDICAYPRRGLEVCELVSPLKPLEAMAAGKTVIGSNVRGLQDMIQDNCTGLLFEKDDITALRKVLQRAIADASLRRRLGNDAQSFVRAERSWAAAARNIDEVYHRAENKNSANHQRLAGLVTGHFNTPTVRPKIFFLPDSSE